MSDIKIAIIEDDSAIASMYEFKFMAENFYVKTAQDGQKGLALLESFQPDIALVDIKMPHMTGDEMIAQLRQTDWGANIRIIVLTNISRDEAPSGLRFLNIDRYLVKAHHTPQQVVDVVKEVLKN